MASEDLIALVMGSRTGSMARRVAESTVKSLSDSERRALVTCPAATRRNAWLITSPHVSRLRRDPYFVHAFEDDDLAAGRDSLELRDWFASSFKCAQVPVGQDPAFPRAAFAAWRVFQDRKNANKVYVPKSVVDSALAAWGFAAGSADGALVASPSNANLVTHLEYSKMQRTIRAFLKGARTLQPRVARELDLSSLDATQAEYARGIAAAPFSCLNGRAGTGKTRLVSAIVSALTSKKLPVICLAPTHRAKKNLANRLPENVALSTVDAFIKSSQSSDKKSAAAPSARFIFVDEASMICLVKLARLARAAMESSSWQVCMVGDDGQLEPIGRGEMFRTALSRGSMSRFTLEKCYRAESLDLFDAQSTVRSGAVPGSTASFDVALHDTDRQVEKHVEEMIRAGDADTQFIAWTNKTCDFINRLMQGRVQGNLTKAGTGQPLPKDRVVYMGRNDVKKGLTNAMVGVVQKPAGQNGIAVEWEGSGTIECATRDVALAYCLTVHKAQGSEFERVCVVATSVAAMMRSLDRRWLYTAVSRAKRRCLLVGTADLRDFVSAPIRKKEPVGVSFALTD